MSSRSRQLAAAVTLTCTLIGAAAADARVRPLRATFERGTLTEFSQWNAVSGLLQVQTRRNAGR